MRQKQRTVYKIKKNVHFDKKKGFQKYVRYIENPMWVSQHGFLPFIHYVQTTQKYDGEKVKDKNRKIFYSSHIDRYIYQYYSYLLNQKYNTYVKNNGTNKCAIAYRNCLYKNNIHFAKDVIDFIKNTQRSLIIVGDFTDYFDNLDHMYLKLKIQQVLGFNRLPEDYYKVFKSVTRFSYIRRDDIAKEYDCDIKELNKLDRLFSTKQLQQAKKEHLEVNRKDFGIPQGCAFSAALSNVYLVDFDKKINDFVTSNKGIYRRYCDDIIIIIPMNDENCHLANSMLKFVFDNIKAVPNLNMNEKKTNIYEFAEATITDVSDDYFEEKRNTKSCLNYLGFSFDGKNVKISDRTISRFYKRLYEKIKTANAFSKKYGRNAFRRRLFSVYSHLGEKQSVKNKGNFLTYVKKAKKVFHDDAVEIHSQTKRHWKVIEKNLVNIRK